MNFILAAYQRVPLGTRWRLFGYNVIALMLGISWLVQLHYLIEEYQPGGFEGNWQVVGVIAIFFVSVVFNYWLTRKSIAVVTNFMLVLSDELWIHYINLEYSEFKKRQRIVFFDIFLVSLWRVRAGLIAFYVIAIPAILFSFCLIAFLFYAEAIIALLFLGFFGVLLVGQFGVRLQFTKKTQRFHLLWREQSYQVGKHIDQFELYALGRGKDKGTSEFKEGFRQFLNAGDDVSLIRAKWEGVQVTILQLIRIGVLVVGYLLYKNGVIELASLFSAVIVIGWVQGQLAKVQSAVPAVLEASDSYKYLLEFFDWRSPKVDDCSEEANILQISSIQLEEVGFSYDKKKAVFDGLNLRLERGNVYLIKGNNGCGKTTLARVLLGLLGDYDGKRIINDQAAQGKLFDSLKYRMSYLHQDCTLFYGTAEENYGFGETQIALGYSEMFKCLFSSSFDPNYHIGDKGEKLSGGQRQRLSLIREWARDVDLYILDEPLNHLDHESSEWLKTSISKKKDEAIIVIFSHQSGFESIADEIKLFKNGKLHDAKHENS